MLRLINVVSGEVELTVMTEKTILSVAAGEDKFKYLDLDTQLLEVEFGGALNEPVTFAVRKTIEGAVVELVNAGQKKGLWKFKAPEWIDPGVKSFDAPALNEEELLEEIIETDNEVRETAKEEIYDDYKNKPQAQEEEVIVDGADGSATLTEEQIKEVIEEMKVEQPISDVILKCESSTHHFGCTEVTNEENTESTDTVIPTGPTDK